MNSLPLRICRPRAGRRKISAAFQMDGTKADVRVMIMLDDIGRSCANSAMPRVNEISENRRNLTLSEGNSALYAVAHKQGQEERHSLKVPSMAQAESIHRSAGEEPDQTGGRSSTLMPDGPRPLSILHRGHALAEALAAGLSSKGWRGWVVSDPGGCPVGPLVVAADDQGCLRLPAASAAPRLLILVGGLLCLRDLADGLLLGASAAVNADLPFPEVIGRVDAVLRAGEPQPGARDRLRGRLRQRKAESDRFRQLTDREAAVLAELAAGRAAADIARHRSVALATVRTQIAGILRKLEVPSQTAAVALTYQACRDKRVLAALRFYQHY